jgi:DNA-binding beta-propeller fold protein YncE
MPFEEEFVNKLRNTQTKTWLRLGGLCLAAFGVVVLSAGLFRTGVFSGVVGAQAQTAPKFNVDVTWPKPLPNKWKMGGVTGLAVDKDDNVWVYDRPNDLTTIELEAELNPPIADCCVHPPSMIHIAGHDGPGYKDGDVIGSFDAPQGHGMAVDKQGFVYLGQNTVRKYDPKTGKLLATVPHVPETPNGQPFTEPKLPQRKPGEGSAGPVAGFIVVPGAPERARGEAANTEAALRQTAFIAKYPPTTPMIIGGIEEVRTDDAANEIYIADNAFGGRVMVFSLDKFEFKRGWGAYGHKLSEISTDPKDHAYTPNGPMAKEFVGHLTFNFSNDGLVYAADRAGNRIHVTDKQGNFKKEIRMAEWTGIGGSAGGVMFSPDKAQKFLYISDLTNNHVWFLNRDDGKIVGQIGSMGHNAGEFFGVHMEAVDSTGKLYTGEVFYGERVQRFLPAK